MAGAQRWQRLSLPTLPPDVKKMPLGKLSKQQIARGFEALEALEVALKAPTDGGPSLEELSSHFYTIIPHNFGRTRPPPINSPELLQAKKDMLLVRAGRWVGSRATRQTGQERWRTDGPQWAGQRMRGEGQTATQGCGDQVDKWGRPWSQRSSAQTSCRCLSP